MSRSNHVGVVVRGLRAMLVCSLFGLLSIPPAWAQAVASADLQGGWSIAGLTVSEDQATPSTSLQGTASVDAKGQVTGGALLHSDGTNHSITGGHLGIDANGGINGLVSVDHTPITVRALLIPSKQAIVGVGTSGQLGMRQFNYFVLARESATVLAQGDLAGSWHVFALNKPVSAGGAWLQGTLSVDFNGALTGGQISHPAPVPPDAVGAGTLTLSSAGAVSGSVVAGADTITVAGVMLPDKNLIVGVGRTDVVNGNVVSFEGVDFVFLEHQSSETFNQAMLAGTWHLHALSGLGSVSVGTWSVGSFSVSASGHLSGSLTGPNGSTAISGGPLTVGPGGMVSGTLDGSSIDISGVMLPSQDMIVGVNTIADTHLNGALAYSIFSVVKAPAIVQFSAAHYTVGEAAGAVKITVTRTGSTTSVATVGYATSDGTAKAGVDYRAASGTLTFGAGVMSQTFTVPIISNTIVDGKRTVNLALSGPGGGAQLGARATAVLTILDDDVGGRVQFSALAYSVKENAGSAMITVTRTGGAASGVSIDYATSDGTARAGVDYTAASGTLTFDAGVMSQTFTVPIIDNAIADGNRSLALILSTPGGGAIVGARAKASLTIVDDEVGLRFSATAYSVKENARAATITVIRTGPSTGALSVQYATSDGTALAGVDYKAVGGTLTFGAGVMSRKFTVPIINNTIVDGNRTLNLTLSAPGGGALLGTPAVAVLTIVDDDVGGRVQFSALAYSVKESAGKATISVTRTGGAASGVTVEYATSDGTAKAGVDYTATSGTLSFGAGVMSQKFTVPIINRITVAAKLTVNLTLSAPGGGALLGARAMAVLTIVDEGITVTTSYDHQNTPAPTDIGMLLAAHGITGAYFDARQYVDLDGDGQLEIIVAPGYETTTATPVHIFKKSGAGYIDATSSFLGTAIPRQIHPRKLISADFNGDGLLDVYFSDTGYDHSPFPGAQNVLVLSDKSSGKWIRKSIPNNPTAYQHCATAGDMRNIGIIDIFVCAEAWQGAAKSPYFLINDGTGNMTVSRTGIPASLIGSGHNHSIGMVAAELIDVDNDGYLDLVACSRTATSAGTVYATAIYWGDGTGTYSDARSTTLPNPPGFAVTYDIKAEDIDGDGVRDILLLRLTGALTGYYFQILRQTSPRVFVDESVPRIIKNPATWEGNRGQWFPWFYMSDINGDGAPDITIGDSSAFVPSRNLRWLNDGKGNFKKQ